MKKNQKWLIWINLSTNVNCGARDAEKRVVWSFVALGRFKGCCIFLLFSWVHPRRFTMAMVTICPWNSMHGNMKPTYSQTAAAAAAASGASGASGELHAPGTLRVKLEWGMKAGGGDGREGGTESFSWGWMPVVAATGPAYRSVWPSGFHPNTNEMKTTGEKSPLRSSQ